MLRGPPPALPGHDSRSRCHVLTTEGPLPPPPLASRCTHGAGGRSTRGRLLIPATACPAPPRRALFPSRSPLGPTFPSVACATRCDRKESPRVDFSSASAESGGRVEQIGQGPRNPALPLSPENPTMPGTIKPKKTVALARILALVAGLQKYFPGGQ